jgi:hypothetical protein
LFHLSTSGDRDGAVEGEYTVVCEWMSADDLGAFDRLGGKFADATASKFKVRVEPKANTVGPLEVTHPGSRHRHQAAAGPVAPPAPSSPGGFAVSRPPAGRRSR